MVKTNNKKSIATLLILAFMLVGVVALIVTPALFIAYGSQYSAYGIKAIWGWQAFFGGQKVIAESKTLTSGFNWQAYCTMLVMVVSGAITYILGPKNRGWYIVGAILVAGCAIMCFTMRIWIPTSTELNAFEKANQHLGVGPWTAGFLSVFAFAACIYEFRAAKLRR